MGRGLKLCSRYNKLENLVCPTVDLTGEFDYTVCCFLLCVCCLLCVCISCVIWGGVSSGKYICNEL